MQQVVNRELESKEEIKNGWSPELPDEVWLNDAKTALQVWRIMRFTEWRWLPDEILRQPKWLLDDLIVIEHHYGLLRRSAE